MSGLVGRSTLRRRMAEIRIGEWLRELREKRGMGLRELARKVDLSPAMVSDVEHGRRTTTKLAKIVQLLDGDMAELVAIAGICTHCGGTGFEKDEPESSTGNR